MINHGNGGFPAKLAILALAGLALAGCSTLTSLSAPSPKTVYEIRAGYDSTFLAPAAEYRSLPDCGAGRHWSATNPCSEVAIIAQLQAADAKAKIALDTAQAFAVSHPGQLGLQGLIDAASASVAAAIAILTSAKGH